MTGGKSHRVMQSDWAAPDQVVAEEVAAVPRSAGGAFQAEGIARARLPLKGSDLRHLWSVLMPLFSPTRPRVLSSGKSGLVVRG